MHTINDKRLLMLKPCDIETSGLILRSSFDEYELRLLADSISSSGIIEPLAVRKNDCGKYELISGHRRLKAAQFAGLRRVPCVLHKTDIATAALFALTENLQRSNLSFFEEAAAIERLIGCYNLSKPEIAARLGISQTTLLNKLELLRLPPTLRSRITGAGLSERYCRVVLTLPENLWEEALDKIIAEGFTLKQTESYISELLCPKVLPEERQPPTRKAAIGDVRLFGNSLSKLIETLRNAGINATSRKVENDKYIEYKVRIKKEPPQSAAATQLKIC